MDLVLREKILNIIKPSEEEHKFRVTVVDDIIKKFEKIASDKKYKVSFFVGGSFGKNTYLKNSSDVDLFARFDKNYDDGKISSFLREILDLSGINYKKQKGSRDYYSFEFVSSKIKFKFEVVPNRNVSLAKDMINTTDVSPLHVEFLKEKIKSNPDLCDEIRLAKQFFKAKGLYGAESYINGLAGHVIDILIAYYGSLENLINDISNWGKEHYVDINGFYKSVDDAKAKLDDDKLSNLIVVDPILKTRNAARALSSENYSKLLILGNNFVDFHFKDFNVEKFDLRKTIKNSKKFAKVNKLKSYFYVFNLDVSGSSEDIVGSKLLKLQKKMKAEFESYDFRVFLDKFYIDLKQNICLFVYFFENDEVPELKKIIGPFVYLKDAVNSFITQRPYYFIEGDRIYSYDKRKITKLKQIAFLDLKICEKKVNKDMSFIKKIKIARN